VSDPRDMHRLAGELADQIIGKITPAQHRLPTPCTDWNVSTVINHVVNAQLTVAAMLSGTPGPESSDAVLGPDPSADFRSSFAVLSAVFNEPGFLERTVPTTFGDAPGTQLVALRVAELTLHAWDLAAATGQSRIFDTGLVAFASAVMHAQPIPRAPGAPFGPQQTVPAIATDADVLAAFAGRTVPEPDRAWQLPEATKSNPQTGVHEQ
jgi:uncharacterized protein (TIGR03086 family)